MKLLSLSEKELSRVLIWWWKTDSSVAILGSLLHTTCARLSHDAVLLQHCDDPTYIWYCKGCEEKVSRWLAIPRVYSKHCRFLLRASQKGEFSFSSYLQVARSAYEAYQSRQA